MAESSSRELGAMRIRQSEVSSLWKSVRVSLHLAKKHRASEDDESGQNGSAYVFIPYRNKAKRGRMDLGLLSKGRATPIRRRGSSVGTSPGHVWGHALMPYMSIHELKAVSTSHRASSAKSARPSYLSTICSCQDHDSSQIS